ncbi:MAG TPA: sigma-70 family RNA polymerase sigma factor [Candidatus Acidoferrum sp.]|jgi:RNA polymerase sigma factor (sigma-70 family)|nr:sigma-70 family RNA polymerase sigma factor [Candidatus Acidoferrum sp.]
MTPVGIKSSKKSSAARDDTRLVKECLAGHEDAWSALIEKYKALIYSIPVKYGLPPHEAAEVFQGTCVELLTRLPELREPRALPKWLMQVAHHQCYRWKRQQQRVVSRDADETLPEPATPAIAEYLVQQTQEEQMLREAMVKLSPQCRRLVELLFLETPPRPYAEVAAELGLAPGSIGFTRQKCIERLRRNLDELGFH